MARTKAKAAEVEVDETEAEATGGDALSAKEAATLIGTDARTLRKFLRSQHGLVGQGQRWAISSDDIPALKDKFEAWHKPKAESTDKPKAKAAKAAPPADDLEADFDDDDLIDEDELDAMDAIEELDDELETL